MSAFTQIAPVLERLEKPLRAQHSKDLDNQLTERLEYLRVGYARLHGWRSHPIDYSEPETRWCYVFKYVAAHADYLYRVLRKGKAAGTRAPLFRSKTAQVACLGGGPGSDVLAVIRYLSSQREKEPVRAVHFVIFDVEPGWEPVVKAVLAEDKSDVKFTAEFRHLDVSDPTTWNDVAFEDFDLVTSSFFVSEIKRIKLGVPAQAFWKAILRSVRPGCVVAFNDNNDERITNYFDRIVASAGAFETLIDDAEEVSCGDSFWPVQSYIDRLDHRPRRNGNTAYRVLRKVR